MNKLKVTTLAVSLLAASFAQAETKSGVIGASVIAPKGGENAFGGYITAMNSDRKMNFYFDGYYSSFDKDQMSHYNFLSQQSFGDDEVNRKYYYTFLHLGANYRITSNLYFYGALGYGWMQEIITLYDPTHILAKNGNYTVEGEEKGSFSTSYGLLFNAGKVNLKAGYISASETAAFGIGYVF